ncbi:hypothetical protein [Yersinia intermedia]|uniref:Tail fiber protein n=1 Tax=Yersinia intermedia TaxID=631 RepID=A0ABX6F7U7_YERIN|nr:hypothetical protein [Yersinia intermedia]QGR64682.1 hypothetical protein FOC38_01225 [Yersinia intermedia]QGR69698.1 hypothetical protein FOC37_04530 [Yersinia intermedia]
MSWYGLGSIACSGTTVTGTGTKWKDNKLGIGAGQALLIPGSGTVKIYEIKSVDSDTKITLVSSPGTIAAGQAYAIMSFYTDSVPDFARRLSAQLSYYQSQMDGWQQILTGTGDITLTAPDNTTVVISSMSKLTNWVTDLQSLGIGLPSMTGINNFDFQTFTFVSGANYIVSSTNWINVPSDISYPAGLVISIKVDYVTGTQIGLEIKPSTVSSANFRAWYLRLGGYPGSRTFTAREIQTSANPVPISGGGTGATTAAGALIALGLTDIGIGLPTQTTIANFDFQTFVFTSGANYAVSSSTWLNVPVEVVYPTGIIISITVISVPGSNVILKLVPHVSSAGKYNTYYVRMSGAAGSRTIYVTQDWNSANPIPLSGGGLGATTAAGAIATLGLGEGSLAPIGVPLLYPSTAPVTSGYLKCNASPFSTTIYPRLATVYPSGVTPDVRSDNTAFIYIVRAL